MGKLLICPEPECQNGITHPWWHWFFTVKLGRINRGMSSSEDYYHCAACNVDYKIWRNYA
jgi:hypothetical protein